MFSLESPDRGDSNEYTQYTIFNIKKENYPKSAAMGFSSKVIKNGLDIVMVNEPSMFEPLKFYCIHKTEPRRSRSLFFSTSPLVAVVALLLLLYCCFTSSLKLRSCRDGKLT